MNKAITLSLTILACFAFSFSYAASFDCSKAKAQFEKQICANAELSKLDEVLNATYKVVLGDAYLPKELIDDQRAWLKYVKKSCSSLKCLQKAYPLRIQYLNDYSSNHVSPFDDADKLNFENMLGLKCNYQDKLPKALESASIVQTFFDQDKSIDYLNEFKRGDHKLQQTKQFSTPESQAECTFPSGNSIRIRVGENAARGYGDCGAFPVFFVSIWINQRKVLSRHWYAGGCRYYDYGNENPIENFKYENGKFYICEVLPEYTALSEQHTNMLANCKAGNDMEIAKLPIDRIEYPLPNAMQKPAGTIEILSGEQPVCQMVVDSITPSQIYNAFKGFLDYPSKEVDNQIELPKGIELSTESIFDFNNDGRLDRVLTSEYTFGWLEKNVLLIQFGKSPDKLKLSDQEILGKDSMVAACQIDHDDIQIEDCLPPQNMSRDLGFEMKANNGSKPVFFQALNSSLYPFKFNNQTYIGVVNHWYETSNYIAVLKPLPSRKFEHTCLIREVPKNF